MEPHEGAYPLIHRDTYAGHETHSIGLTIRAEFSKAAMQGIVSNPRDWTVDGKRIITVDDAAVLAVEAADALIAELNKKETV